MTRSPVVIKVGGNEVDDAAWLRDLAAAAARIPSAVFVHGGGREVTELQRTLGAEPEWRDGLRYTGPEALRSVSMVLSGVVNKRIVAALLSAGIDAVGISGEDGALLRARMLRGGALGRTGEVAAVRGGLLRTMLDAGLTPVVSPVSRGEDGGPLNVNADEAAAAVAAALGAAELLLVSNVAGVFDGEERVLREIRRSEVEALITTGTASGGMIPKLRAASRALEGGAGAVRIGGIAMLGDPSAGTRLCRDGTSMAAA